MKTIVDSCVFIDTFDPKSSNYSSSLEFLELLSKKKILMTMPSHGWFEVQCNLEKLKKEKRFLGPKILDKMNYEIELIHIDNEFIKKYAMVEIPYSKAGDHIFLVVAKVNDYILVTRDKNMYRIAKEININVYTPEEYCSQIH